MSKDVKRMSLEEAETFTSDQVTSAIKRCRSSRAYGPDSLSIFHLKNLGPLATEHLTALYNDSLKSCRLPSIWKTSLIIPIPSPARTHHKAPPTDPSCWNIYWSYGIVYKSAVGPVWTAATSTGVV